MKRLISALAFALCGPATAAPTFSDSEVNAFCEGKWGTDFRMQNHCRKKIRDGFDEYSALKTQIDASATQTGNREMVDAFDFCEGKWDHQWNMVAHCARKQLKGLDDAMAIVATLPNPTGPLILNECFTKWRLQFNMVAYCMDKQATAWRQMNGG